MESSPDTTTRSSPDSSVIGLIENPTANPVNIDMPGTSDEPNPEAPKHTPSTTTDGTSNAAGIGSGGAEGSKTPAVRLAPFQCLPQSTQEELGKELFDDPLLTIDNVKKLADYMQWSFNIPRLTFFYCCCLFRVVGDI